MLFLDVETAYAKDPRPVNPKAYISTVCAIDDSDNGYEWVFNHSERGCSSTDRDQVIDIRKLIHSTGGVIACHNAKFDVSWLYYLGIDTFPFTIYCSMVAEYLLSGHVRSTKNKGTIGLNAVAALYGASQKQDKVKEYWEAGVETKDVPLEILLTYNMQDCKLLKNIVKKQYPKLGKAGLLPVFKLKMEEIKCLVEMEYNGLLVDSNEKQRLTEYFTGELEETKLKIFNRAGRTFDLNSPQQLSAFLYGGTYSVGANESYLREYKKKGTVLKHRRSKVEKSFPGIFTPIKGTELKSEGHYSTGIPTLSQLRSRKKEDKELLKWLEYISSCEQQLSTFCHGLDKYIIDGKVHSQFNNCKSITGRFTSESPNLQNQSRDTTAPTRGMFITRY